MKRGIIIAVKMETEDLNVNQYWLNVGVTKTAHPNYNCLWCINEDLEVISVVVPRELIMSSLNLGAQFGNSYRFYSTVGLAFIRHIEQNSDSSFLNPVFYSTGDNTDIMDQITNAIVKYPDKANDIIQNVKKSELHSETLRNLVINKKYSNMQNLVMVHLRRAINWRRIKATDSDYDMEETPVYWYTYENCELRLDFGFKYRIQLRTFLRKPSVSGLISAPFTLLILLGYYVYRFFADKFSKTS